MKDTILNIALVALILGGSALVTNWFARAMYIRCTACGTLNARRRIQCRACANNLR